MSEDIRCECGVFGIFGAKSAAQMTYFGLYALQHRGQEGAGIVTFDGTQLHEVRGQGEVADSSTVGSDSPNCKGSGDRSQPLLHHRTRRHCARSNRGDHSQRRERLAAGRTPQPDNAESLKSTSSNRDRSSRPHGYGNSAAFDRQEQEEELVEMIADALKRIQAPTACSFSTRTRWWRRAIHTDFDRWRWGVSGRAGW